MFEGIGRNTKGASLSQTASVSLRLWREAAETLAAIPFPRHCPVCRGIRRRVSEVSCPSCADNLQIVGRLICPHCRRYRPFDSTPCSSCHDARPPLAVSLVGLLDLAWRDIIHAFKYGGDRSLAVPLGSLMAESTPGAAALDAVVPIPTEPAKRRERGYGHAELLAKRISEVHSIPIVLNALTRTRRTKDQTRLRGPQRRANLSGAFGTREAHKFDGKSVLIVDDVMTTGATITEAARTLTEAGAREIFAMVLCLNLGIVSDGRY